MSSLLDAFISAAGPAVKRAVSDQLDLDAAQAEEAVPAVARPLLGGLRDTLDAPEQNLSTLTTLYQFLSDDDRPTDPAAASAASSDSTAATLVEQLTGRTLDGFAKQVAPQVGIDSGTAQTLVLTVAPKLFAFLRGRTQSDGFDTLLASVLDDADSAKVKAVLKFIEGSGSLGSAMKGIGGLFGS
jgi:hypothetical protein